MSTDNEFSYPASTDFVTVNEWVHDTDRMFEELVCACLGLATELERMRYDRAELAAQPPAGYFIDVKTDGVSTGRIEQAADCYADDPDVFPLYRRAAPASNSMIEAGDGKALSDRAKHLVRLITGTHRGDIETHRELYELIDSMAVAIDSPSSATAPSVPDGWREGVESAARLIDMKAELYSTQFGHDDMGGLSFGTGAHAEIKMDHYTGLLELADEVRAMLAAAPKPEAQDTDPNHGPTPGDPLAWGSQAVLDVAAERRRQIEKEGWAPLPTRAPKE